MDGVPQDGDHGILIVLRLHDGPWSERQIGPFDYFFPAGQGLLPFSNVQIILGQPTGPPPGALLRLSIRGGVQEELEDHGAVVAQRLLEPLDLCNVGFEFSLVLGQRSAVPGAVKYHDLALGRDANPEPP